MRINPGYRVISLADGSVMIGSGPGGLWIEGLDPAEREFVRGLGAPPGAQTPSTTLSADRQRELLDVLQPVLVDEAVYRLPGARADSLSPDVAQWSAAYGLHAGPLVERRARAVVRIHGLDRCGQALGMLLAAAGIGTLQLSDTAKTTTVDLGVGPLRLADLGLPRTQALARHVERQSPRTRVTEWKPALEPGTIAADATVALGRDSLDDDIHAHLAATGVPHLQVVFTDCGVRIGPFVVPGATACLECVSPAPAVPTVPAAGLQGPQEPTPSDPEVSLAAVAAGICAAQVLMVVDGVNVPASMDAVLVFDLATGNLSRTPVVPRPECGCRLRAA